MSEQNPLETVMKHEIMEIKDSPPNTVSFSYQVIIHTPNTDIKALMVSSVTVLRDYLTRFGDVTSIQVSVPLGDAIHDILPNHTNLEVTIIKTPLITAAVYRENEAEPVRSERFTAKIYNVKDLLLEGKQLMTASHRAANQVDLFDIDMQLIPPELEEIRTVTFGGVARDCTGVDLIMGVLAKNSPGVGITIDPFYDTTVRNHIVVPHNTRIVDLPKMVNKLVGGIFPTGFRYYMQKKMWYIYAPWNVKRYHASKQTLTIINLAKDKLAELEVTYRTTGTQVLLLATGDVSQLNVSEQLLQSRGNGVRFVDSSQVVEGFGEVVNNKLIVKRGTNITQAMDSKVQRKVNYAPEAPVRITQAYNLEYSELARRTGTILQVVWESAEIDILFPGMPVRFMYMDGGHAKEIYGRLIAAESQTKSTVRTVKNRIFTNDAILTVFVSSSSKEEIGTVPVNA